jgi:hypothetical protein
MYIIASQHCCIFRTTRYPIELPFCCLCNQDRSHVVRQNFSCSSCPVTYVTLQSGMSAMTASGSKSSVSRQPHNIPLPSSPEKSTSQQNSKMRKKGKEKEGNVPPPRGVGQDEWDHSRASTQPWQWVSLTDSSASKHPPIFTKDGRCAFLLGRLIFDMHH